MASTACTADGTCPAAAVGFLASAPSLVDSTVFLVGFALLVPVNLATGWRFQTPMHAAFMVTGCLLEIMGYVGRVLLRQDLAHRGHFVLYLLGTVLGPTLFSAAIYVVLPHVMAVYGSLDGGIVSQPLWMVFLFLGLNIFTLAFQGVGCAFAAEGTTAPEMSQGTNILLTGLGLQLVSLVVFYGTFCWLMIKVKQHEDRINTRYSDIFQSSRFKLFLTSLHFAAFFILIRTISRMAQLAGGLEAAHAQAEVLFLILDGATTLFAAVILSIIPPGLAFGSGAWTATSPHHHRRSSIDDARRRHHHHHHHHGHRYSHDALSSRGRGRHPYAAPLTTTFFSPGPPLPAPLQQQVPGHWQQPGFAQPSLANYAPPYRKQPVTPPAHHNSSHTPRRSVSPEASETESRYKRTSDRPVSSSEAYDLPPWERPAKQVPFMPPDPETTRGQKRGSGGANDVVDPEAIW